MVKKTTQFIKATSVLITAAVLLTGCATNTVKHQPKASYREFTDATWRPETSVRPPMRSLEMAVDSAAALQEGVYAFYDTHTSFFSTRALEQ